MTTYVWVIVLYNVIGHAVGLFATADGKPIVYPNQPTCQNALVANHLADINLFGQHGKCRIQQTLGHRHRHALHVRG